MKIKKVTSLGNGLLEVEFEDGLRSQIPETESEVEDRPEHHIKAARELFSKDGGVGKDRAKGID